MLQAVHVCVVAAILRLSVLCNLPCAALSEAQQLLYGYYYYCICCSGVTQMCLHAWGPATRTTCAHPT